VWLTHKSSDPGRVVVSWQTAESGDSTVRYGLTEQYGQIAHIDENVTLHHVEIPLGSKDGTYHYSVATGRDSSPDAAFKGYPSDKLRVAVVANWQGKPRLDAIRKDSVHILMTFVKASAELTVDIKGLDGSVLDSVRYAARKPPP
jgi:hypothetical protein